MDVTCERCGTEYEFDETLLSGRGTSVKCTNCGHVFRVYPSVDRTTSTWRVRLRDGSIEEIEALKELQDRIALGTLSPEDEISRGGEPWKPLGTIAELETFFAARAATSAAQADRQRNVKQTILGTAPAVQGRSTLPPAGQTAPPSQTVKHAKPIPSTRVHEPASNPPQEPSASPSSVPPPSSPPVAMSPRAATPTPTPQRAYFDDEDEIPVLPGRRSRKGLWIVVALGAVVALVVAAQWESIAKRLGDASQEPTKTEAAPAAAASSSPTPEVVTPKPPAPPVTAKTTTLAPPEPPPPPPKEPEKAAQPEPVVKAAPPEPEPVPPSAAPRPKPSLAYDEYDRMPAAADAPNTPDKFVDGRPVAGDYNDFMKQAAAALAAGSLERARIYYESALEARPGSAEATDGLASVALKSGNPTLAVRYLRAAARRGDPSAYFRMGKIYRSMGQEEQAVSAYYTYLKRHPSGAHAAEAREAIKAIEPYAALPEDPNAPKTEQKPAQAPSDKTPKSPEPDANKEPAKP